MHYVETLQRAQKIAESSNSHFNLFSCLVVKNSLSVHQKQSNLHKVIKDNDTYSVYTRVICVEKKVS